MATEFLIKDDLSDYTEQEFFKLLERIIGNEGREEDESKLVLHFNLICGHPTGADLIFYPEDGADDSAQGIIESLKKWRSDHGLSGFKQ